MSSRSEESRHTRRNAIQVLSLGALCASTFVACDEPSEGPPPLEKLREFEFTDQDGQTFTQKDLQGKVWVASFMFTRCPTTCPRMMRYMKQLQDRAQAQNVPLHLVTFSVDPENDTPEVLKAFAKEYGVDLDSWSFLTGNYEQVKQTSVNGFKMSLEGKANPEKDGFGILHGSHLVLVDQKLEIRGYYPTKEDDTLNRLIADARRLGARS